MSRTDSDVDTSNLSSSIMSYSDFDETTIIQDDDGNEVSKSKAPEQKQKATRAGCCLNIRKMATHTKIVPQERLYQYLADRSIEIEEGELLFSQKSKESTNKSQ